MQVSAETYNIYFDKEISSVVMEWNGYSTSQEFKEGTEVMLNLLIQNNTSRVLADIRDMVLIASEDQEWLDKQFLPRAIRFGFKSIAIIRPKNYFNKVAV